MPAFLRHLVITLFFDYLYDRLIEILRTYVEKTDNPIDDAVVDFLFDMRDRFKDQIK